MHRWLYTGRLAVLATAVACAPAGAQPATTPAPTPAPAAAAWPAANPADVATPEAILTALYDVISGPASQERDWNRFRSLYRPDGRLSFIQTGPQGQQRLHSLQVEDFIRLAGPGYRTGGGFWERDVSHRIDRFGSIAHIFTTYETRRTGPDGPRRCARHQQRAADPVRGPLVGHEPGVRPRDAGQPYSAGVPEPGERVKPGTGKTFPHTESAESAESRLC
jgi:hypothetical protein